MLLKIADMQQLNVAQLISSVPNASFKKKNAQYARCAISMYFLILFLT